MTTQAPSGSFTLPRPSQVARAEARRRAEQSLLLDINPFRRNVVENPWNPSQDTPDVESIYAGETRRVLQVLKEVHATQSSQGVLLLGEAGAGKSHLLRRLANRYRDQAVYVYLYSPTSLGTVFRTIHRACAVNLAETPPNQTRRQIDQFIDRLIERHAFRAFSRAATTAAERRDLLGLVDEQGEALWRDEPNAVRVLDALERHLRTEEPALDRSYLRAFLRARIESLDTLALDWLKGEALDDDDLARLGVRKAMETEEDAYEALRSLGYLSRFHKPVVIAFDQTENLPDVNGQPGIGVLVNAICRLHPLPNMAFVVVCPTDVWTRKYRHQLHQSERQRVENLVLPLGMSGLHAEQLTELLAARLATIYRGFNPPYPSYPFGPDYVAALSAQARLQPREALNHFRDLVEEMKTRGKCKELGAADWATRMSVPVDLAALEKPVVEPDTPEAAVAALDDVDIVVLTDDDDDDDDDVSPSAPTQATSRTIVPPSGEPEIEKLAEEIFAEEIDLVRASRSGTDLADADFTRALRTALDALSRHGPGPGSHGLRPVLEPPLAFGEREAIVFAPAHENGAASPDAGDDDPQTARTALVVCETRRGQSFAALIARCVEVLGYGTDRFPRVILVRGRDERRSWTRGREHLARFLRQGGERIKLDDLGRAHLAALLSLLRRASAGDLFFEDETVGAEELLAALVQGGVIDSLPVVRQVLGIAPLGAPALGADAPDGRAVAQARRKSSLEERLSRLIAANHIMGFRKALERLRDDDPKLTDVALRGAVVACQKQGLLAVLGNDPDDPLICSSR